jgi:thiamine pyrophosphate-dependent acetolactate synthase large subunit-like protein
VNRFEAIRVIIDRISDDELVFHANGAISRESFACRDRRRNFYLLGTMGLPAAVGLGAAVSAPDRKVVVLDGDGNLLMGFGNLAMVGAMKPPNLIHIVLDNGVYGTTGDQPSVSPALDLTVLAGAAGYRSAASASGEEELGAALKEALATSGPHFIRVTVSREVPVEAPRIPYTAKEIRKRFMDAQSS